MADMQSLMAIVQRLESQGVDVMGLLQGAAMGGAGSMGSGAITAGEEFRGRMGPRSYVDDAGFEGRMGPRSDFQGPGPGAVVTEEDMAARLAARDRGKMPSYMQSTLDRLMRESGNVTGTRPVRPMPPGILKLLGGM
jgi:hypothetical protein